MEPVSGFSFVAGACSGWHSRAALSQLSATEGKVSQLATVLGAGTPHFLHMFSWVFAFWPTVDAPPVVLPPARSVCPSSARRRLPRRPKLPPRLRDRRNATRACA